MTTNWQPEILTTTRTVRISKKLLATLPQEARDALVQIQDRYPNIKSISTYRTATPACWFYAGEGYRYTVTNTGGATASVEMVAEHNIGSAGVSHAIGANFQVPFVGAFVFRVYYYDKFYLEVTHIVPRQMEGNTLEG